MTSRAEYLRAADIARLTCSVPLSTLLKTPMTAKSDVDPMQNVLIVETLRKKTFQSGDCPQ